MISSCTIICYLACIFLFSMMYMLFFTLNKDNELKELLNENELARYRKIRRERRNLMLIGYLLGLIAAVLVIVTIKGRELKICLSVVVVYICSYYFYTLAPKSDYMILHLETNEKRQAWLSVYLKMKKNYHISMILGLIFVLLASYASTFN